MYHGFQYVKFFDGLTLGRGLPYSAWAYVASHARERSARSRQPPAAAVWFAPRANAKALRHRPAMTFDAIAADHPFLKGFKAEYLELLAANALPAHFQAGEVIFREGEMANRFYLITKGAVVLETYSKDGGSALVEKIGAGDVLGWSWLFPPYYWRMDARAVEASNAIFFYGTRLRHEAEQNHDLGYELMRRVAAVAIQRLQAARGFPREHSLTL
jgi:CRP/FNR family cyclic AMP-dependent transcriptional regulator